MAGLKKLQQFEFPERSGGFASKYDWDEILSGETVFLQEGKDYDRDTDSFLSTIRTKANARGLGVNMVKIVAGSDVAKKYKLQVNGIVAQARPGTPEEVERWQAQAEARKEANKERAKAKREAKMSGASA